MEIVSLKIKDLPAEARPREAGEVVGIPLDDHVVIGADGAHVSITGLTGKMWYNMRHAY